MNETEAKTILLATKCYRMYWARYIYAAAAVQSTVIYMFCWLIDYNPTLWVVIAWFSFNSLCAHFAREVYLKDIEKLHGKTGGLTITLQV